MNATLTEYLHNLPAKPGVYFMYNASGEILYVGKAKSLKKRVASYFCKSVFHRPKIGLMVAMVARIDKIETCSEVEALLLEAKMIQELQPKYNTRQKDDKSYPYIVITKEPLPRVLIARKSECNPVDNFEFYGPYIDSTALRASYKLLQKIFRFRTCTLNIPEHGIPYYRPCLLASIRYCTAPCAARVAAETYRQEIESLRQFLQQDHKSFVATLQQQMQQHAERWEFEAAAKLRDQIKMITSLDKRPLRHDALDVDFSATDPRQSLIAAQKLLNLAEVPTVIEGIDIAHHGGHEAVGSLVSFVDGLPCKEGYRRYRIRSQATDDDYLMLAEVLTRRFCGKDKDRKPPDIFLVDGGKGQLNSVVKAMAQIGTKVPAVVSLAKQNEEIYLPGHELPLPLAKDSLVHRLFCHVRDEAHRFAQRYHHHLKSRQVKH